MSQPPSLQGKPISSLVAPGECQLTEDWQPMEMIERVSVSPTSSVLRFALPDTTKPLNLSTCACILAKANAGDLDPTEDIIRPYTPISTNAQTGSFDLLVKDYGPEAKMSHKMCTLMHVGDSLLFKHAAANVKIQAPFTAKDIVMLVGGTGITPMIQALHAILGTASNATSPQKVQMLYGSKTTSDILGKEMIDQWAETYSDRFSVTHILSEEPAESDWQGARGFIDQNSLEEVLPKPTAGTDVMIFVCGPPPLYDALCGPREDKEKITGLLGTMGYQANQIYKF